MAGELLDAAAAAVLAAALRWTPALLLAAAIAAFARRASAAQRHGAWAGACLAAVVVLVGGTRLPAWELPALGGWWSPVRAAAAGAMGLDRAAAAGAAAPADPATETVPAPQRLRSGAGGAVPALVSRSPRALSAIWLGGVALLLLREVWRSLAARHLVRRCAELRLASPAALPVPRGSRGLALRVGPVPVPAVAGILRPRVLLPAGVERWPAPWVEAALLHERAHVERRDLGWLLLARLVRAVLWFHPGTWLATRRVAAEAEMACDECAVAAGLDPLGYAQALVEIAGAARSRRHAVPVLAAVDRPSELRRRVVRLLASPARARVRSPWLPATALVACGVLFAGARLATAAFEIAPAPPRLPAGWLPLRSVGADGWALRCAAADPQCRTTTATALALLRREGAPGVVLVQRVADGTVTGYAALAAGPGPQPGVPWLAPASLAKLALAAGWWESGLPEPQLTCSPRVPGAPGLRSPVPAALRNRHAGVGDLVVHSCTSAAVELAGSLAERRGEAALAGALAPLLAPDALAPRGPDAAAFAATAGVDWALQAAGVGELATTPIVAARFLQAVAADGLGAQPRAATAAPEPSAAPLRLFSAATALRLRTALRDAARHGTASAAARASAGVPWRLAGKTGTTANAEGSLDGWFAGLVENTGGTPEHVVVVWLQGAGPGGGRPTLLAADVARALAR